jgi:chromosome segregation ATPase
LGKAAKMLEEQVEETKADKERGTEALQKETVALGEARKEVEVLRAEVERIEKECNDVRRELGEVDGAKCVAEGELGEVKREVERLEGEVQGLKAAVEEERGKLHLTQEAMGREETAHESCRTARAESEMEVQKRGVRIEELEAELAEALRTMEVTRSTLGVNPKP